MTVLGLDIGGTKLAVGLAADDGTVIARHRLEAAAERGPGPMIADLLALARRLLGETGATPEMAGISVGGPLDAARGVVICPPGLSGWLDVPLRAVVERELGLPAVLENDANAAALAERRWGHGRGLSNLLYVTVSTGIGAGVIVHGRLLRGAGDGAGEIGHVIVRPGGQPCPCGNRGCLAAEASGTAIGQKARARLGSGDGADGELRRLADGDPSRVTARLVAEAALAGDEVAGAVWAEAMDCLAEGIAAAIHLLAPERVIVGGGVAAAGEALFRPLRRGVAERVHLVPAYAIRIGPSSFGADEAGLMGAFAAGLARGDGAV